MSVSGELKDISLFNIIQMICLDGRNAALAISKPDDKAMIFFEKGEVVHAITASSLSGETAFFNLLSWGTGKFIIKNDVNIPSRTITSSWKRLLLAAMQEIDEKGKDVPEAVQATAVVSEAEAAQDGQLEEDLITLLSELEFSQTNLGGKKISHRPDLAIKMLGDMVNSTVNQAKKYLDLEATGHSLAAHLAQTKELFPATEFLQVLDQRLGVETAAALLHSLDDDPAGRQKLYLEMREGMIYLMGVYCNNLFSCFSSPEIAEEWHDTVKIFVRDLSQITKQIKF